MLRRYASFPQGRIVICINESRNKTAFSISDSKNSIAAVSALCTISAERRVTHKAKWLYTLLLDRATLSQKNNWVDTAGRVYMLYPIAHLARDLHCSRSSITRAFTELEKYGLLARLHSGFSKPSRILLKIPQDVQRSPSMLCTSASSDGAQVTSMDVQNCIPNHLNRNQQKYNYKQKQKNMPGLPEYIFEEGESL